MYSSHEINVIYETASGDSTTRTLSVGGQAVEQGAYSKLTVVSNDGGVLDVGENPFEYTRYSNSQLIIFTVSGNATVYIVDYVDNNNNDGNGNDDGGETECTHDQKSYTSISAELHEVKCTDCGILLSQSAHVFDNNVCTYCGYENSNDDGNDDGGDETTYPVYNVTVINNSSYELKLDYMDNHGEHITSYLASGGSGSFGVKSDHQALDVWAVDDSKISVSSTSYQYHNYDIGNALGFTVTGDGSIVIIDYVSSECLHELYVYESAGSFIHYVNCAECGEYIAETGHSFSDNVCTLCGYDKSSSSGNDDGEQECTHESYMYSISTDLIHIKICTDCDQTLAEESHEFEGYICTKCGYDCTPEETCTHDTYTYTPLTNTTHSIKCSACNEDFGTEGHNFVDNKCTRCSYEEVVVYDVDIFNKLSTSDIEVHYMDSSGEQIVETVVARMETTISVKQNTYVFIVCSNNILLTVDVDVSDDYVVSPTDSGFKISVKGNGYIDVSD